MAGHLMAFAAFFMEAHPGTPFLGLDIFDLHLKGSANAGKCVDHQGN